MTHVLRLAHLTHYYPGSDQAALSDISLTVAAGECLGIVGESGCGKSTLARVVTRLLRPTAGRVEIGGKDWASVAEHRLAPLHRDIQLIFQDPAAALSPRRTVWQSLLEPLQAHRRLRGPAAQAAALSVLGQVGLDAELLSRYPHQLSGGQRQRVVIARALAVQPRLLVADEPVASLDVSVQAQILNLFARLRDELGLAMLFISHDLAAVASLCQRIAVIYRGRIVEQAATSQLLTHAAHPYTRRLLAAARHPLSGDVSNRVSDSPPDGGCAYRRQCSEAFGRCAEQMPVLQAVALAGGDGVAPVAGVTDEHQVSCHRVARDTEHE